jgi:prophage antirepressor-like protein
MKKTNEIRQVFNFNPSNQQIRVEIIDGEPWFVVKDLCDCLELTDTNKSVSKLEQDEYLMRKLFVSGQNRDVILVNESGLYNLIFRSYKHKARPFRKWVTSEVLPQIRKTGRYESWQNGAMMYCEPANNRELVENFCAIAMRETVKIANTRQRVRLYRLVEFMAGKVK